MPCEWYKTADGTVIHVNRGRGGKKQVCKFCGDTYSEGKLCDFPVGNGRTCDAAMCNKCSRTVGHQHTDAGAGMKRLNDTIDVCPIHRDQAVIVDGKIKEQEGAGMAKKQLKPALPKDQAQINEKGFRGNISGSDKFITDGNVIILRSEMKNPKAGFPLCKDENPVKLESMQRLWDGVAGRKGVPGEFIGCASIKGNVFAESHTVIAAVIKRHGGGCTVLNPWKLAFVVAMTGGNRLSVSAENNWRSDAIAALRGETLVAIIMPMRYTERDLEACDYDLTGAAVPIGGK